MLTERPVITIVMTTYAPNNELGPVRVDACLRAIDSLQRNIVYDGVLALHIADDGSECGDWATSKNSEPSKYWKRGPYSFSRQEARGVGASMNAGFSKAFSVSPLAFYTVDDWELLYPLDLRPWADVMTVDESVGLVLLGPPSVFTAGQIAWWLKDSDLWKTEYPDTDNWLYGLRVDAKQSSYGYTQRPALMHQRFFNRWGAMPENGGAVWAEQVYNDSWKAGNGEDIIQAFEQIWHNMGGGAELGILHPPDRLRNRS